MQRLKENIPCIMHGKTDSTSKRIESTRLEDIQEANLFQAPQQHSPFK